MIQTNRGEFCLFSEGNSKNSTFTTIKKSNGPAGEEKELQERKRMKAAGVESGGSVSLLLGPNLELVN